MIVVVDDNQKAVHILGLNYEHISSLCKCLLKNVHNKRIKRLNEVQQAAREIPAHIFYRYHSVHLFFLSWMQIEVLWAMVIDVLAERCDFFLDELLEALTEALKIKDGIKNIHS